MTSKLLGTGLVASVVTALLLQITPANAANAKLWQERTAAQPAAAAKAGPDFSDVAAELQEAVVSLSVEAEAAVSSGPGRMQQLPPFFERFFGPNADPRRFRGMPQPGPQQGQGSGFFIREDGLLLTNYHVVENAKRIEVTMLLADGSERTLEAEVVGSAPDYDVALVKTTTPANAKVAYLGSSNSLKVGEWVMAIGSPFGLSHSVSLGIVSAKGRRDIAPSGRAGVYDFIQTDASINPGNSGGPLVNARGEVVGINTAMNAAGQGIGFAVPIDLVKQMLPQLEKDGRFARGYLGVRIQEVSRELAKSFGLDRPRGALVAEVMKGSAAAKAGLEAGDIILKFNGQPIHHSSDLPVVAGSAGAGNKVELELWRNKRSQRMSMTLGELEPDTTVARAGGRGTGLSSGALGLQILDIDAQMAERLGLSSRKGALVTGVRAGSPAARAGLREGDVVVAVNNTEVKSAGHLAKLLKNAKEGEVMRLKLWRDSGHFFVALEKRTPKN